MTWHDRPIIVKAHKRYHTNDRKVLLFGRLLRPSMPRQNSLKSMLQSLKLFELD